jgi:hypothetical protein
MEIKSVSNQNPYLNQLKVIKPESYQNSEKIDKVEISGEGKELAKLEISNKRLLAIRIRIESNFYNSDMVLSKVADKIYNELK